MDHIAESRRIMNKSLEEEKEYFVSVLGKKFIVIPGVFSPKYFVDTNFFAEALPIKKGTRILDMGTGTGIIAIISALKGAREVVGIDINPKAVENAKKNVEIHKLKDKIRILEGDLFKPLISKNEKFNIIFWNFPWGYVEEDILMHERAIFDPFYKGLETFFKEAPNYLNKTGKIFIGFSLIMANVKRFEELLKKYNLEYKVVKEGKLTHISDKTMFQLLEIKKE